MIVLKSIIEGFVYIYMNPLIHAMMMIALASAVRIPVYTDDQGVVDEDKSSQAKYLYIYLYIYHTTAIAFSLLRSEVVEEYQDRCKVTRIASYWDIALMMLTAVTNILLCHL